MPVLTEIPQGDVVLRFHDMRGKDILAVLPALQQGRACVDFGRGPISGTGTRIVLE